MSNSNRFVMGSVALVLLASGVILVLSGCGSGFGAAPTPPAAWDGMKIHDEYVACLKRADAHHEEYLVFMQKWHNAHPEVTLEQLEDVLQLHGEEAQTKAIGKLKGMTATERFQLWMWIDSDKNRTFWKSCDTTLQTQLQNQEYFDRERQRLQPRFLYIVP